MVVSSARRDRRQSDGRSAGKRHRWNGAGAPLAPLTVQDARATTDEAEARSDAPKSIAASLLVPADMLSIGVPGDDAGGGAQSGTTAVPTSPQVAVTHAPQNGATHENPFLVPDAGRLRGRERPRAHASSANRQVAHRHASLGGYADVTGTLMSVSLASRLGGADVTGGGGRP